MLRGDRQRDTILAPDLLLLGMMQRAEMMMQVGKEAAETVDVILSRKMVLGQVLGLMR